MRVRPSCSILLRTASCALAASLWAPSQAQTSLIYHLPGGAAAERQGAAVAAVGDVDGDGVADLLVGAPGLFGGIGQVRVLSGTNGAGGLLLPGLAAGWEFGTALDAADLNGDGRADPIVGAFRGGPGEHGFVQTYDGLSGLPMVALQGASAGEHFGFSVAALDDVDGDGLADFAVGSPDFGGPSQGSVRIVGGAFGSTLTTLLGAAPKELFGYALCGVGDVDGDGRGDLAIGAPWIPTSTGPAGRVVVVSGASGATLRTFHGSGNGDTFGRALARVGDFDGDGFEELAIGAPQALGAQVGYVQVVSPKTGALFVTLSGQSGSDLFGSSVAAAGDVDGDGTPDVAVGAPRRDAAGTDSGEVTLHSGQSGLVLAHVAGASAGAQLGTSLDGGFDPNEDGVVDVVAGAPLEKQGALATGSARALSTRPLALESFTHLMSLANATPQALDLDAGVAHAGEGFLLLGSFSGNKPGTFVGGLHVALNPDRYFHWSMLRQSGGPVQGQFGTLDANGQAQAHFTPPALSNPGLLMGLTFRHAFLTFGGTSQATMGSNVVPVTLVP